MESETQGIDYEGGWHTARTLHCDLGGGYCEECSRTENDFDGKSIFVKVRWPCKTILALEGRL